MPKSIPEHPLSWMPKSVWGPIKWKELHARALAFIPMEKEREWFDSFVQSIPCPHCQEHFKLFLEKNPPDLSSRANFFRWSVSLHNHVNRANNKAELSLSQALTANEEVILSEPDSYEEPHS